MKKIFLLLLCIVVLPCFSEAPLANHILYLLQSGQYGRGIEQYQSLVNSTHKHDYQMLEQIGNIILNQGAQSDDETTQLLSMYGAALSGSKEIMYLFEKGMQSKNPSTQLATINFLRQNSNDQAITLLTKAFSSPYPIVRLEAAYALCEKKAHRTTGLIYSLMQRFPPPYQGTFANLFAMMGCQESLSILKKLIGHKNTYVRIAAILAAANFGRDDFTALIKRGFNHAGAVEKEACVYALGYFQDFSSLKTFTQIAKNPNPNLALCASKALVNLGDEKGYERVIVEAKKKNPFAIFMLQGIENSDALLLQLLCDKDKNVRLNATVALLEKRNPVCTDSVIDLLTKKSSDLGFIPIQSQAGALFAWKSITSCREVSKKLKQNLPLITHQFKEKMLVNALELPQESFLKIAKHVLDEDNNTLIPVVIRLLESIASEDVKQLLEQESNKVGCPFNRTYSHLSLYRLKSNTQYHKSKLIEWASNQKNHTLIEFKPLPTFDKNYALENTFQLTPQEKSQLLIETFDALATSHDKEGIDLLINLIKEGHDQNRYLLAGLLMKCIL
ncbi:hypothetical protein COB21_00145 [Candidatus Aerophobetes bacterium]|uniref:HEAT repeat domain-containing protein n=1 Tax=Aerophobetes bacterium TaxID=2030807 RepID=A0A2A4X807_UNCAE|nr:MAG: hypothetical protein COB21_00145 [Candidatus Aerophobetes bacterium]